jgi:hypothetical protein
MAFYYLLAFLPLWLLCARSFSSQATFSSKFNLPTAGIGVHPPVIKVATHTQSYHYQGSQAPHGRTAIAQIS